MTSPDYGPRARVGVAVPQANPTVEPEMRALLPDEIGVYATRLVHPAPRVEDRLLHYVTHIPDSIASYGPLRLAAFGFGCTGSSYIVGSKKEDELTAAAAHERQMPVVTAAQAIRQALTGMGAARIALVSPYPEALAESGYTYWRSAGIEVAHTLRVDERLADTHNIYELTSQDALTAVQNVRTDAVDCIVVSGTGMPTLAALRQSAATMALPVISSNLCLAWALLGRAAPELAPTLPIGLITSKP